MEEMHCVICRIEMPFEVPPCADDHDDDCPELICTGCGAALVLAPVTVRYWHPAAGRRVAPIQRRRAA